MNADALVLTKPRTLELRTLPVPRVDDESGLLRIEACGLCGTDHEQFSGHLPAEFAFIPGHEIVGVIEEVGDAARARWGVSVGQRVAVEVFRSCRECHECDRGEYRRCSRNGLATMFGFVDVNVAPGLWGGYATHLHLPFDSMLLSVPDGLDPILATLFNPLGAGIKWAAMLPETGPGDVVAVLGPGIRGPYPLQDLQRVIGVLRGPRLTGPHRDTAARPWWPFRRPRQPASSVIPRPAPHRHHLIQDQAPVLLRRLHIRLGVPGGDLGPRRHRQPTSHA